MKNIKELKEQAEKLSELIGLWQDSNWLLEDINYELKEDPKNFRLKIESVMADEKIKQLQGYTLDLMQEMGIDLKMYRMFD